MSQEKIHRSKHTQRGREKKKRNIEGMEEGKGEGGDGEREGERE